MPASERWGVCLFAAPHASLKSFISGEAGICVYVWGILSHPEVALGGISAWYARVVAKGRYNYCSDCGEDDAGLPKILPAGKAGEGERDAF